MEISVTKEVGFLKSMAGIRRGDVISSKVVPSPGWAVWGCSLRLIRDGGEGLNLKPGRTTIWELSVVKGKNQTLSWLIKKMSKHFCELWFPVHLPWTAIRKILFDSDFIKKFYSCWTIKHVHIKMIICICLYSVLNELLSGVMKGLNCRRFKDHRINWTFLSTLS